MQTAVQQQETVTHSSSEPRIYQRARKWLWSGVGLLWIVDGLLQAKPDTFTSDFYAIYPNSVMPSLLQTVADEQPSWLHAVMTQGALVWGTHPVTFNLFAIVVELLIGIGMVFWRGRPIGYWAVWGSVVWGLVVWVFGQGFGGLLSSGNNFLTGAPGSSLFYLLASIILLVPVRWSHVSLLSLKYALALFWIAEVCSQVWPQTGDWTANVLMAPFANAASLAQPYFIAAPVQSFALWVMHTPGITNGVMCAFMLVLSASFLRATWSKWTMFIALLWLFWLWWFTEDFGGLFSGLSPDLGNVPPLALLIVYVCIALQEECEFCRWTEDKNGLRKNRYRGTPRGYLS